MAKIDLSKLSLAELHELVRDAATAIKDFEKTKRAEALAAIEKTASEFGFKVSDLLGGKAPKGSKPAQPAKYRHPENASVTWSGRGRKPAWIIDGLAKGKKLEDFSI